MKKFVNKLAVVSVALSVSFSASGAEVNAVPASDLIMPDDLEVTVWASSPLLQNPTNMDTDSQGRIWVAEGVNYRREIHRPEGDRIVVLEDTDHDGVADTSHTFVQDPELISPLGVSVFDNQIVVAQPPHIIVYTDVDRDLRFDPKVDKRENFLSGFNGRNHDHSLHSTVSGPDGKWYINQGNCGAQIKDADGREFSFGGPYYNKGAGNVEWFNNPTEYAGKPSADGNVYSGGFAGRINPDGTGLEVIGHGFRNSYELCVNSFGDVFQNDNDDPPACRNTWLMEGGFLGFFSKDGTREWQLDRRPGQSIAKAEWRQDDPGSLPAGDVHGTGSPTGVVFYENGALPKKYEGMFLSCEARARTIQRYHPKLSDSGAAVELGKRSLFLSCPDNDGFRPSDVVVGADGAIYVADWFDTKVGGHRANDTTHAGTIYRIAPKGFRPQIPAMTGDNIQDAITLLKSPANNVRFTGLNRLKAEGKAALPAVRELLDKGSRWEQARAVWLLPHLGKGGSLTCWERLEHDDPEQRILAFRSLRNSRRNITGLAYNLTNDPRAAVRREAAVALRNADPEKKLPLVIELFRKANGTDRHYLEACGLAANGIEAKVWEALEKNKPADPLTWSDQFVWQTWRLLPEAAVPGLLKRATSEKLSEADRKFAMETLAFIGTREAVAAITELASAPGELGANAKWWLINRGLDDWAKFGTLATLKKRGIYDPEKIELQYITVPEQPKKSKLPPVSELLKLKGDPAVGRQISTACATCHRINGAGPDYGPDLRNWVANQSKEAFLTALIYPSESIAHGYVGQTVTLKNGEVIEGLVFGTRDPLVVVSTGGIEQLVPKDRVKNKKRMWGKSLMMSAEQLGLTPQYLADLAAYFETY